MSDDIKKFGETRDALDKVSPSFCVAKWKQVTLHLHTGNTHSCHHPDTHRVPLKELEKDPSALHNTEFKKRLRKSMLEGKRPKECHYCWRVEDSAKELFSDRIVKSSEAWARPYLDEISQSPWTQNADPSYLEVNFGNLCNMKCSYCLPHISSQWMKELEEHGPYPVSNVVHSLEFTEQQNKTIWKGSDETNPYLQAFWKWWPDLYPKLLHLRVTGGEPLLNPNTFRMIDYVIANPRPDLNLSINSNLMVPADKLTKFIEQAKLIQADQKVAELAVFTSIDTWGAQAEYIRHGLRHDYFWKSVERVLRELPSSPLVFMVTFNALSIVGFQKLLEHLIALRETFPQIRLNFSHLTNPPHQNVKILPASYLTRMSQLISFMKSAGNAFAPKELQEMERIFAWMAAPEPKTNLIRNRKDFYLFFREHDQRRGTNFLETFPEMEDFWRGCELLVADEYGLVDFARSGAADTSSRMSSK
jgi:organic radical activating enzyme